MLLLFDSYVMLDHFLTVSMKPVYAMYYNGYYHLLVQTSYSMDAVIGIKNSIAPPW